MSNSSIQFSTSTTGGTGSGSFPVNTIRSNKYGTVPENYATAMAHDVIATIEVTNDVVTVSSELIQYCTPSLYAVWGSDWIIPQQGGMIEYFMKSHYDVAFYNVPSYVTIQVDGVTVTEGQKVSASHSATQIIQKGDKDPVKKLIQLTYAANNTGQDRSTNNTFCMKHYSGSTLVSDNAVYINRTQSGEIVEGIEINPSSIYIPQTGGSVAFTLTSDASWTITGIPSWLTLSQTAGTGSAVITASTAENATNDRRSVTVTASTSNNADYLGVIQEGRQELSFTVTGAGTLKWATTSTGWVTTIQYSKNNGTWTDITATTGGTSINVAAGDVIRWRGANTRYGNATNYCHFDGDATYNVSGYLYSLLQYTGYTQPSYAYKYLYDGYNFRNLFMETNVVNASGLIMQENELTPYCYMSMFEDCYSLTNAPALPGGWLAEGCYQEMFYGCGVLTQSPDLFSGLLVKNCYKRMFYECNALNTVKCGATDISAVDCTTDWLYDVEVQGVFYKHPQTTWPSSDSGIPQGWEIRNY